MIEVRMTGLFLARVVGRVGPAVAGLAARVVALEQAVEVVDKVVYKQLANTQKKKKWHKKM